MNTLISIPLEAALADELRQTIAQEATSLEVVLSDLVQKYVRDFRRKKIQAEFDHYQTLHPHLVTTYLGQHVAIHEGQMIDHDADPTVLVQRVRQRFGRLPILFTQVTETPVREFVMRSPRLVIEE